MRGAGSRCWQGPTGLEKCFTRWTPSMEVYLSLFFLLLLEEFGGRGFVGYRRVFGVIEDRVELRGI